MSGSRNTAHIQGEGEIEVYHYGRYFTVTGKGRDEIKDGQAVVDSIVWEYFRGYKHYRRRRLKQGKQRQDIHERIKKLKEV